MADYLGFIVQIAGLTLVAAGFVWLLGRTFPDSEYWGTALFFLPALSPFYILLHPRRTLGPFLVLVLGACVLLAPYGLKLYMRTHINLGERVKEVDGEQHVTLTGWNKQDYDLLAHLPDVVVLHMANGDVTDETLKHLTGMTRLRELDLNDSQVTDAGLKLLAQLPKLQELRLRATRITDAGFRESLLPMESLRIVEVTGTAVKGATLREWKNAKAGRDYLN